MLEGVRAVLLVCANNVSPNFVVWEFVNLLEWEILIVFMGRVY